MKFRWVRGYEGSYAVSDNGCVVSYKYGYPRKLHQWTSKGYSFVTLSKCGVTKAMLVHRLVADAFMNRSSNCAEVNHIDGNKLNNNISNLEWVTKSNNIRHAFATGLKSPANTRKIGMYSTSGVLLQTFNSIAEAQRAIQKPSGGGIRQCLTKTHCKSAYGYVWKYLE